MTVPPCVPVGLALRQSQTQAQHFAQTGTSMHQACFFLRPAAGTHDDRLKHGNDLQRIDVRVVQREKDQNSITTVACIEESILQVRIDCYS